MAAKIITSKNELKNILATTLAGKTVGLQCVFTSITANFLNKLYPIAMYNFVKVREAFDYTICAPVVLNTLRRDWGTHQQLVDLISSNISMYPCDYVYIDPDQYNFLSANEDLTSPKEPWHWLIHKTTTTVLVLERFAEVFTPFVEMKDFCSVTSLTYDQNIFSSTIGYKESTNRAYTLVQQLARKLYYTHYPYFDREFSFPQKPVKNEEMIAIGNNINVDTDTLEQINRKLSDICAYYDIVNLDGNEATIEDIRNREAFVILYDDENKILDGGRNFSGSLVWLGATETGAYEVFPNRGWKENIFTTDFRDFMLNKWPNPQYSDREAFLADIMDYYNRKYT